MHTHTRTHVRARAHTHTHTREEAERHEEEDTLLVELAAKGEERSGVLLVADARSQKLVPS